LAVNSNIGMQISILQGSATGTAVYVESFSPTTNANGLVTIEIGTGTVVSGNFTNIDWSTGTYFIKTETDLNGGANYTITGTSQMLSVPYALYAKTAEQVDGMTYVKAITLGTDGKLTFTPSTGSVISYDAKSYVTYAISLINNVLTVNGVVKGTVVIPPLTFGTDGKLMTGTIVIADLTTFFKNGLTLGTDNYLYINGQKTTVLIPPAYVPPIAHKTVNDVHIVGNDLVINYTDATTYTIALPSTAIVTSTGANGHLLINGIDTGVMVTNTYGVVGGFLTVNGVPTTVAIPALTFFWS